MGDIETYVKEIKPGIYLLDEGHSATGYLVVGDKKAAVIDTMCGENNLYDIVRGLTDKPLVVINTHGHGDHICGNVFFDEAYMNLKDIPVSKLFTESPEFIEGTKAEGVSMPPFKDIHGGDVVDLGGRTLEIYDLPGHTPGGIVLLLKEDRVLFAGDSINHHLWMQLDGCLPISEYVKELDKVMFLEERADIILHGHAQDYDDISLLRCLRDGCAEIAAGQTADDKPYEWFGGVGKMHLFKKVPGKHYQQKDSVICYNPENV